MKYKFIRSDGEKPILTTEFEEEGFELLNTFLLSEVRNFGSVIEQGLYELTVNEKREFSFSGNVYSLEADAEKALITDDISDDEISLGTDTKELYELVKAYRAEYKKLKKNNSTLGSVGGEHDG